MNRKGWMVVGVGCVGAFVACSNKVEITAEKGVTAAGLAPEGSPPRGDGPSGA